MPPKHFWWLAEAQEAEREAGSGRVGLTAQDRAELLQLLDDAEIP